MPSKEHLLDQVSKIAERRRNEPGEMHPFRKVKTVCKYCEKSLVIHQHNLKESGNCCKKCWSKDSNYLTTHRKGIEKRSENPDWKQNILLSNKENGKKTEIRKKISCTKQGCSIEDFPGFQKYKPYCEKFDEPFKEEGVREFQGHKCALCGHEWKKGEIKLAVHHIHNKKDSCCNENSPRAFVCLCSRGCHHRTMGKEQVFAGRFIRYLLKNFNGKSYFTKQEREQKANNSR